MANRHNHKVTINPSAPSWNYQYGAFASLVIDRDVTLPDISNVQIPCAGSMSLLQDSTGGWIFTPPGRRSVNFEIGLEPGDLTQLSWKYDEHGFTWYAERIASAEAATVFSSDFNGAADSAPTADAGTIYSVTNLECDGAGGLRLNDTGALARMRLSGSLNGTVKATIRTVSTSGDHTIFLILRCNSDFTNRITFALKKTGGVWYTNVSRTIGGTTVDILTDAAVSVNNGDEFVAKVNSTTCFVSINNASVRSAAHGAGAISDTDVVYQDLGSNTVIEKIEGVEA